LISAPTASPQPSLVRLIKLIKEPATQWLLALPGSMQKRARRGGDAHYLGVPIAAAPTMLAYVSEQRVLRDIFHCKDFRK
jgi:hypothetical protein